MAVPTQTKATVATGAAGFIGSQLVDRLVSVDHRDPTREAHTPANPTAGSGVPQPSGAAGSNLAAAMHRAVDVGLGFKRRESIYGRRMSAEDIRTLLVTDLPAGPASAETLLNHVTSVVLPLCKNEANPRFLGFGDTGDDPASLRNRRGAGTADPTEPDQPELRRPERYLRRDRRPAMAARPARLSHPGRRRDHDGVGRRRDHHPRRHGQQRRRNDARPGEPRSRHHADRSPGPWPVHHRGAAGHRTLQRPQLPDVARHRRADHRGGHRHLGSDRRQTRSRPARSPRHRSGQPHGHRLLGTQHRQGNARRAPPYDDHR